MQASLKKYANHTDNANHLQTHIHTPSLGLGRPVLVKPYTSPSTSAKSTPKEAGTKKNVKKESKAAEEHNAFARKMDDRRKAHRTQ